MSGGGAPAPPDRPALEPADLLAAAIEELPQGICVYDPDCRVRLFNPAYAAIMAGAPLAVGERLEDIVRRRVAAGEFGPGDPAALVERLLAYDRTRAQTRRRRRPNGVFLESRWVPLADGGFMLVCTDITPLVESEHAVRRRVAEMDLMLAGLRHGVILWGPDRRLVAANPMAAELLGLPPEQMPPGCTHAELIDALQARGYLGSGVLAQGVAAELKGRDWQQPWVRHFVNPAGRFIERRAKPVAGGMNLTTFTDVTESREAERAMRRAKEAAEAANQAKSRFLATMSHELRTPLNAVIGFSEALLAVASAGPSARAGEYASAINQAGRQLLGLIDSVLDVARLEAGQFDLTEAVLDPARLVRTALRQFEGAAEAGGIELRVDLPAALPGLRADRRRMSQVLHQLLSNAVKFTASGGTVTVGIRCDAAMLRLWVADTGIGIPEADLARVFDPFTQLDARLARRFPGAGLGLYLARALVQSHHGTLGLTSEPGMGTVAEIRLPAERLVRAGVEHAAGSGQDAAAPEIPISREPTAPQEPP